MLDLYINKEFNYILSCLFNNIKKRFNISLAPKIKNIINQLSKDNKKVYIK